MTNSIKILGDPHLGRSFINNVPLARRGEREVFVWQEFTHDLMSANGFDYHVCLGDLFDKAVVPYDVVARAADVYIKAANAFPETTFIILKGNHDWMRDLERVSAFDLFSMIVAGEPNIIVVDTFYQIDNRMAFFAWHPTIPAAEMVGQITGTVEEAFGHWDVEAFGDHNPNLIPTKELAQKGVVHATTGHIHKPHTFTRDGVEVDVWGSMQPYAHGEEVNPNIYITLTKVEFEQIKIDLKNLCVRILLGPDETFDQEVDCLQLTIKRIGGDDEEQEAVTLGDFDMVALFTQAFTEAGVSERTTSSMLDQYNQKRLADGL